MKKKRPAVLHFIDKEREKGATDQQIRHRLLDAGWHMDIIHRAMHSGEGQPRPKSRRQKPVWQKVNPGPLVLVGLVLVIVLLLALFI